MTALYNYVYYVTITVAQVVDGVVGTKAYQFSSKIQKTTQDPDFYKPLLRSIGEISLAAGETLPEITLSSIEIDNSIGSFGPNRKFSDILERYSVIEQPIAIYVDRVSTADDSTQASSLKKLIGTGVISDWSANSADGEGTITFNIRPTKISDNILTLEVARTISGMENAPQSSLGRAIPLVIGDEGEVIPTRITADGATSPRYAVTTTLGGTYVTSFSAAKLYSKNELNDWEAVEQPPITTITDTSGGTYTLNTYASRAFGLIRPGVTCSALATGVILSCKGNGLASSTAKLSIFLLRYNALSYQVIEEVTRGTVDLSIFNGSNAASVNPFDITIPFDDVVFLSDLERYAIGWSFSGYQVGDLSLHYTTNVANNTLELRRDTSDANSGNGFEWKVASLSSPCIRYRLVTYSINYYGSLGAYGTQNGLGYSRMDLTLVYNPSFGLSYTPPDNVPLLIAGIKGLTSGGTTVEKPHLVAEMLGCSWNGTSWYTTTTWDVTTLSSSHYDSLYNGSAPSVRTRITRGTFENKTTYVQMLADLCKGTASRVGIFPDGKLFMYPFGQTVAPVKDIPYADITSIEWKQGDVSTVINRAQVKLGKTYLKAPRTFENSSTAGYQYSYDFAANNYPRVAAMTAESRLLFGNKELSSGELNIWPSSGALLFGGYLTSDLFGQGSIVGEYYLARYGKPLTYCTFIVPFDRYDTLKMFDVITFTSVNFPAFYGTDSNARDGTVDVAGAVSSVTTADGGNETVRAKTYRGLIEGIVYIMAMEHAPAIRLVVQVLLNQPHDPT